jgi:hypothetical protein
LVVTGRRIEPPTYRSGNECSTSDPPGCGPTFGYSLYLPVICAFGGRHIFGLFFLRLQAFVEDPKNPPEVMSHTGTDREFIRFSTGNGAYYRRAMRQFGVHLPTIINAGIGPRLRAGTDASTMGMVYPTRYFDGAETDINIAGMFTLIVLVH